MGRFKQLLAGPLVPPSHGKTPYLWIGSLVFMLWKYFYVAPSLLEAALLVLTVLVFVPLYFFSFRARGTQSMLCVALTCLIGVLWAPHNFGASSFFIFATAMCAGIMPERLAYAVVAMVLAMALAIAWSVHFSQFSFLVPSLTVGLPVGLAAIMEAKLRRSRDQLLRKQEEVEHMATIAERERISRDLHDLLGHTLSLITLKAELAGKLLGRDADACAREIGDIEHSARNALAEVRAAVSGYRQVGLAHELASARAALGSAGVLMESEVQPLALNAAQENVLALVLREAVTNILRHAGARRCSVSLAQDGAYLLLRIADDGGARSVVKGNGLTGMHERVATLGGSLALHAGAGLALEVRLPMGETA